MAEIHDEPEGDGQVSDLTAVADSSDALRRMDEGTLRELLALTMDKAAKPAPVDPFASVSQLLATEGPEAPSAAIPAALAAKIAKAAGEVGAVEKRGENKQQHYNYVMAEDVVREAQKALREAGVLVLPTIGQVAVAREWQAGSGATWIMLRVEMLYRVVDAETGEAVVLRAIGLGADSPGDKAIYKAQTGAAKYFYAGLLGIPFGADPEESTGEGAGAQQANGGNGRSKPRAQAQRREGQQDGTAPASTAPQRRKIHARASELGLEPNQLKALMEWETGTAHSDRIPRNAASDLIDKLDKAGEGAELLQPISDALESGDDKAKAKAEGLVARYLVQNGGATETEAEQETLPATGGGGE